jgi:hypothetical protein
MRQPTTTLTTKKPAVSLELSDAYNVILEETGDPLLDEAGSQLVGEAFARKVTLTTVCPTVALELRRFP